MTTEKKPLSREGAFKMELDNKSFRQGKVGDAV
jgi:hypothetical protein